MNFITKVKLKENTDKSHYPYNIPILSDFNEMKLESPVTFFVGENGSGKSTFIEAIAVACGLNAEGGSQNFNFSTNDTHSDLYNNLIVSKSGVLPKTKYFLRAESFYNVASEIEKIPDALFSHGNKSLHNYSHGESFITLVENRFYDKGLYILDEPEAALSPLKQMRLLILIDKLVKGGSQFIIATHSPILLAYPNSTINDFDNGMIETKYEDMEHFKLYKMFINDPANVLSKLIED